MIALWSKMHLSMSPIVDYTSNALLRFLLPPPLLPLPLLLVTYKFIYIFNDMSLRKRCEWFRFNILRTWVCWCCFFFSLSPFLVSSFNRKIHFAYKTVAFFLEFNLSFPRKWCQFVLIGTVVSDAIHLEKRIYNAVPSNSCERTLWNESEEKKAKKRNKNGSLLIRSINATPHRKYTTNI